MAKPIPLSAFAQLDTIVGAQKDALEESLAETVGVKEALSAEFDPPPRPFRAALTKASRKDPHATPVITQNHKGPLLVTPTDTGEYEISLVKGKTYSPAIKETYGQVFEFTGEDEQNFEMSQVAIAQMTEQGLTVIEKGKAEFFAQKAEVEASTSPEVTEETPQVPISPTQEPEVEVVSTVEEESQQVESSLELELDPDKKADLGEFLDNLPSEDIEAIPADVNQSTYDSPTPQFASNTWSSDFVQGNEQAVVKTQNWLKTLKAKIVQGFEAGKNWLTALKDGWRDRQTQGLLQSFKDDVSQRTVKLGLEIASLPDKIAQKSLMQTIVDKYEQGKAWGGEETVSLGEFQIHKTGEQYSFGTKEQPNIMAFTANKQQLGQDFQLNSHLTSAEMLKQVRSLSADLNTSSRQTLQTAIQQQIESLNLGSSAGKWTKRAYQEESFLDNGRGDMIRVSDLDSMNYEQLQTLEKTLTSSVKAQTFNENMNALLGILKIRQEPSFENDQFQIQLDGDNKTLTFTAGSESVTAKGLGEGQWQLQEGELSPQWSAKIQQQIKPQVAQKLAEQHKKAVFQQAVAVL